MFEGVDVRDYDCRMGFSAVKTVVRRCGSDCMVELPVSSTKQSALPAVALSVVFISADGAALCSAVCH